MVRTMSERRGGDAEEAITMEINSLDFATWCFDNGVRIGWMLPVAAATDQDSATEILAEFAREADDDSLVKTFGEPLRDCLADVENPEDEEDVFLAVRDYILDRRLTGFLVRVERQVRRYDSLNKNMYAAGWGHFQMVTWYADAIGPEFVERVQVWADKRLAAEKAKPEKLKVRG
jgi:hypothetical protein